ncbi:MAG: hypothetical protein AAF687_13630 [Pseudomonadota bacterium]
MSKHVKDILARGDARIVEAPVAAKPDAKADEGRVQHQIEIDRNFELPTRLYGYTVAAYLTFLGILAAALSTPGLIIPMAIFVAFIVAGFGVPAIWTRLNSNIPGGNDTKPMTMGQFDNVGIMTYTGRLAPRDATIQVLILPVLIVMWGCAIAIIAAIV